MLIGYSRRYQQPLVKRLTKSARARANRRKRQDEAAVMDVGAVA
jgi:hypothetical protein